MKTSEKVILGAALVITTLIFTTMIIIRDDIQTQFVKEDTWKFRTIETGEFNRLDFSRNYQAEIQSGLDYLVEIAVKDSTILYPVVEAVDGTLYFSDRSSDSLMTSRIIKARITMPVLKSVWGRTGSEITIRNFQSDSMTVSIEKGCVLKGKENVIKYLTFRAGDALMEWTNNP